MDSKQLEKDTWKVIYNYFDNNKFYLTKHHQDSYNDFILNKIPLTFKQYNPQILYKDFDKDKKTYNYEIQIYYGGKNSDKIYITKPITYQDIDGNIVKKQLYPNEARLRNLTYSAHIFCDIVVDYKIRTGDSERLVTKTYEKVNIGKIPIMLQSKICPLHNMSFETRRQAGECPYDQGGYFVIDGQEKVIVSHERKVENKLYIIKSGEGLFSYSAQIKSIPEDTFKYARTTVVNINSRDETITIRLPMLNKQVPLFMMFRVLGIESDKEILKYILYELDSKKSKILMEKLRPSIENNGQLYQKESVIKYLSMYTAGKTTSHFIDIISSDLFPHVGDNYKDKAFYLGYVVNKLLHVSLDLEKPTDRDSFMYKRVDLSGFLLASLFRENFKQFQRDAKIAIDTEYRFNTSQYQNLNYADIINPSNIKKIFNHQVIETAFMKSFKIGKILNKKGLIQSLNRLSSVGAVSQLRRINTISDMVMMGQRKLHSTQYGIICPVETPDGGNIGIKKHLTITGHITFGCSPKPIIDALYEYETIKLTDIRPEDVVNSCKVMINGRWIGIHNNPKELVYSLRLLRRNGLINLFTSISWNIDNNEISILTDGGRCCRPLYIVKDNKLILTPDILSKLDSKEIKWDNLIAGFKERKTPLDYYNCEYLCPTNENFNKTNTITDLENNQSVCEFLDTDELNTSLISGNFDFLNTESSNYTHCEIHSSLIMGALGFTIPYCNQSQAPRNVYGTGQSKQSVGLYISNFRNRFDTSAHVLYYPQRPLIKTKLSDRVFVNKLPTGLNAIVAIACYSGYNQEDSIIFNKSSLERGLFRSCYFKTYDSTEMSDSKNGMDDLFLNPTQHNIDINLKKEYNFSKLDNDGFVKEGTYVTENDVLIGKYSKIGSGSSTSYMDSSVAVKKSGDGVVDKVFCDYYNTNKQRMCKVRICTDRMPEIGDKFASRHGQKGTIGMILPKEDMPFTKDGIVPDLIINPHAIPSRMTIGQFVECVMGKACSLLGCMSDGTPFTNIDYLEICKILEEKCGYENYGDEILYSGILGNQMATKIFIGPTYYQRLKHMVRDKVNSRASGKMTLKNHQPPAGKAAGGGLRIGEMERDAIISHGVFQFLKESTMERSDDYSCYISENSGMISIANPSKNKYLCPSTSGPLKFDGEEDVDDLKLNMENNKNTNIYRVKIPYNIKMMIQECEAMGMALRLIPKPDPQFAPVDLSKRKIQYQKYKKKDKQYKPKIDFKKLRTDKVFNIGNTVKCTMRGKYYGSIGKIDKKIDDDKYRVEITESKNESIIGQKRVFQSKFLEPEFVVPSYIQEQQKYTPPEFLPSYIQEQQAYVRPSSDAYVPPSSDAYVPPKSGLGIYVPPSTEENLGSPVGYEPFTPEFNTKAYNPTTPEFTIPDQYKDNSEGYKAPELGNSDNNDTPSYAPTSADLEQMKETADIRAPVFKFDPNSVAKGYESNDSDIGKYMPPGFQEEEKAENKAPSPTYFAESPKGYESNDSDIGKYMPPGFQAKEKAKNKAPSPTYFAESPTGFQVEEKDESKTPSPTYFAESPTGFQVEYESESKDKSEKNKSETRDLSGGFNVDDLKELNLEDL